MFPFEDLSSDSVGFEFGAGTGLWSSLVSQKTGKIHLLDHRQADLDKARIICGDEFSYHQVGFSNIKLPEEKLVDFGIALETLHLSDDVRVTLKQLCSLLKFGAPFLVYLRAMPDGRLAKLKSKITEYIYPSENLEATERRYTRSQIVTLLEEVGLDQIEISEKGSYWTAVGRVGMESNG